MLVIFRSCIKNRPDSVLEIPAWAQESLSVNTATSTDVKAPSGREEAKCEHDPETLLCSLVQSSFKMD